MAESLGAYEHYRLSAIVAAEAWERAAETARSGGLLELAHQCNDRAIRWRWLAEPDDEMAELFNAATAGRPVRPEVPRD